MFLLAGGFYSTNLAVSTKGLSQHALQACISPSPVSIELYTAEKQSRKQNGLKPHVHFPSLSASLSNK